MLLAAILLVLPLSTFAADTGKKGTLAIPKRPGSAKQSSENAVIPPAAREIQQRYAGIKDIKGTFVQKSYIKDLEDTQEYSGDFSIKKPSQMMWEYAAPRDEKVIINDKQTLIYKKSQNQVIKTKFNKEAYSQVPIALLAGLENIGDDFHITVPSENALQLVPRRKIGFIKTVVLETIQGDMPIKMFTIFDTYGNIIMIEMKNVQINQGLKDSVFTLTIPPDAEVYDMSQ
jgi:outer membrane lipoprotein carrier protein